MFAISHLLHKNMIMEWPLAIAAIPSGWTLCDGTLGTPDLRNSFIVGAGDTYAIAATGGGTIHRHTSAFEAHSHFLSPGGDIAAGLDFGADTDPADLSGYTNYSNNMPPYYALAYIMKL